MESLESFLDELLAAIAAATGTESGAVFLADAAPGDVPPEAAGADPGPAHLVIVAALGLGSDAAAGLATAVTNPAHAVARTFATGETGFDVLPVAPGGPALRSHLPLIVAHAGTEEILGVLAIAHDRPIETGLRPALLAAADLAAVAIDRSRSR